MVSLSQTIFTNSLGDAMVAGHDLDGRPKAYSVAIDRIFYLGASVAVASWMFSWGMGWTTLHVARLSSDPGSERD